MTDMPTLSFHTPSGSDFPDEETPCKAAARVTGPVLPLRVFLVEDSAILRDRLAEMFATWANVEMVGHAETEAAAEAALRTQNWDVLILDLQLLHGTGLGVLATLRTHRKPGTTVIVLTNYAIPSYRARSLELGADYFFDKASDFEKIKDVFTRLGEQRRAARPNG
ncbi:MAG: response regulator transcription factor [Betaproteobacteria bacterium]|nr:response regulator transcription factor [Betaproteobacteria bacterium]MBI2290921.1 response regulator transcription factor [Betaproteobacteria bacterium]